MMQFDMHQMPSVHFHLASAIGTSLDSNIAMIGVNGYGNLDFGGL